jgi:glycosyltransferase involved in cell wall biosynthesis
MLVGRRDDVDDLMRSSAMAIHPSRGEAFSLAILEYMRAALPVVVPDVPSVRQAVEHEVTGLVYRDGDIDGAARAIARIAQDRALAIRLGTRGAERVRTTYSLLETNRQFSEALAVAFHRLT